MVVILGVYNCYILYHPNSFRGGMVKFPAKLDADLLL